MSTAKILIGAAVLANQRDENARKASIAIRDLARTFGDLRLVTTDRNELRQLVAEALAILEETDDRLSTRDWIRSAKAALGRIRPC